MILLLMSLMMMFFLSFLQVAWQWLPIKSSARKDDLQLYHWVISSLPICCESLSISFFLMPFLLSSQVRVVNGVPPTADYSFAKYNKVLVLYPLDDCLLHSLL